MTALHSLLKYARDIRGQTTRLFQRGLQRNNVAVNVLTTSPGAPRGGFPALSTKLSSSFTSEARETSVRPQPALAEGFLACGLGRQGVPHALLVLCLLLIRSWPAFLDLGRSSAPHQQECSASEMCVKPTLPLQLCRSK